MSEFNASRRRFVEQWPLVGAAALGAVAVGAAAGASGGPPAQAQAVKSVRGSWFGVLTAADGRTSRGLATFTPDGGLVTTNQGDTLASRPQGGGHGAWVQEGAAIRTRILKFVGNAEGVLSAIIEEVTSGTLDESGDAFTVDASYKLYDLNGYVLEERSGTITARRITMTGDLNFPRG